jgi:hypothetical protein
VELGDEESANQELEAAQLMLNAGIGMLRTLPPARSDDVERLCSLGAESLIQVLVSALRHLAPFPRNVVPPVKDQRDQQRSMLDGADSSGHAAAWVALGAMSSAFCASTNRFPSG